MHLERQATTFVLEQAFPSPFAIPIPLGPCRLHVTKFDIDSMFVSNVNLLHLELEEEIESVPTLHDYKWSWM